MSKILDRLNKILRDLLDDGHTNHLNYQNDYTNLLSSKELQQLYVFNKVERYNQIYESLKNKDEKFSKKDILWAIYNESRLEYEYSKDLVMLSVVFERQAEILINDKKCKQALDTYTTSLYCLLYNFEYSTKEINLFDRHLNNRRIERIKMLLKNSNTTKKSYKEEFDVCIKENIPAFYDSSKCKTISNQILKRI